MRNNKIIGNSKTNSSFQSKKTAQGVNFNEAVTMKFLEKSAQYLGVYVKNRPSDYRYRCECSANAIN